ncbi:MAG: SprT family zinc-dependent metalloprotease [bacterium]|nr:SprT family zinc-dependent metalloprotease [bacterium]
MRREISYTLKRSRRSKYMRLAVGHDGVLTVTIPFGVDWSVIERLIESKRQWILSKIKFFKSIDKDVVRVFLKGDYVKHKEEALGLAKDRVAHFNAVYRHSFNKISIRNQKTRWGSCSKKGNLSFNYKILFLPQAERDYIIVHEICHLSEFNHSPEFWSLVEKTVPNYRDIKKTLRRQEFYLK